MAARSIGYRADLDGLRAIAVGLVMLMHARVPWSDNGGDVGVTAFFVLSGYLITSLLLQERMRTGQISLRHFYVRRVLRLGPALVLLLVAVVLASLVVRWPGSWQLGVLSSLAYLSNWIESLGVSIDPLGHTWTLAIEEQFYLLWPMAMIVGFRWLKPIAVLGLILGFVLRVASDGTFEYFATVTRGDAILAGCLLGLGGWRLPQASSIAGSVGLVLLTFTSLPRDAVVPLATGFALLVVAGDWPRLGILAPIGRRAYGLYLWNWPLTILFGPWAVPPTFVIAELSYRLLEQPVMRLRRQARAALDQGVQDGAMVGATASADPGARGWRPRLGSVSLRR